MAWGCPATERKKVLTHRDTIHLHCSYSASFSVRAKVSNINPLATFLHLSLKRDINHTSLYNCEKPMVLDKALWNPWQVFRVVHLFSHSVVSNSLRPHGLWHTRLPCPSLSPGICSNSCPWTQWCHPTISSSVALLSSCLQSFPASGSFLMSQLFGKVAKVLELQHQSFQWIFSVDFL